ncbi:MAG: prepilin peptidase [Patescibacteria group bacterium]|nr:prepilin peptidase [Patescibacteria group bacterium]
MLFFTLAALFVLGAVTASFIGVLVARLNTGGSFLTGRSHCDACGVALSPFSLVPIVSYLAYAGRARCCGVRLRQTAPATEFLLGCLFALAYVRLGFVLALPFMLLSFAALFALVLYDLMHQVLPPVPLTVFVLASAGTGLLLAPDFVAFGVSFSVALVLSLSLLFVHLLSGGRAMGFADAPLVFGLALLAGPAALPGFAFSFWVGAVIGIAMLARRPRGSRMGVEVPFAPFLATGFLLAYFTQWNPFIITAISSPTFFQ